MLKHILSIVLVLVLLPQTKAENINKKGVIIYTNIDFVTQHSWRGGLADDTFSIEPMVEVTTGKLTFGAWAAATINDKYKELDLYISYSPIKGFSLGIYDYYCPPTRLSLSKFDNFKKWHILDAIASYNFQKIPLKLTVATVIGGMDSDFSTYMEASYTQPLFNKKTELVLLVAGTPKKGDYASKATLVNTEIILKHNFTLKKNVTMPIFARLVHNPHKKKTYFIVGLSFSGTSLL